MRRDVLDTFLNMVRDPGMTQLDLKSQLAANHVAKQRMLELYADYGADVVETVSEELIRQSEQLVRNRLSELPDGEWRAREYIDMPGANATVELTAIKEGDTLTYDFTGSSPQAELGVNVLLLGDLGRPLRADLPAARLGRDLERGRDAADRTDRAGGDDRQLHSAGSESIATVGTIQIVNNLSTLVLSKMFGASERYAGRATAVSARQPCSRRDARADRGR